MDPQDLAKPPDLEPLTLSLVGRFFGIPLLIIGLIVGGAVTVVLLFGAPASPPQRGIEELVQALETDAGQKSMGMLLPPDKEYWQTGLELAERLEKEAIEAGQRIMIAKRVSAIVQSELQKTERDSGATGNGMRPGTRGTTRLEFLVHALGRTRQPEAVETLIEVVRSGREPFVTAGIEELANLHQLPDAAAAVEPIMAALRTSDRAETRLAACAALSVLAKPTDQIVIDALARVRLAEEGEVGWNAALALARLGSDVGKSTLLDLLTRSFWETDARYEVREEGSATPRRYPMPPQRINGALIAAIDAASNLHDLDLWEMIDLLKSDPSLAVRERAEAALQHRPAERLSTAAG